MRPTITLSDDSEHRKAAVPLTASARNLSPRLQNASPSAARQQLWQPQTADTVSDELSAGREPRRPPAGEGVPAHQDFLPVAAVSFTA